MYIFIYFPHNCTTNLTDLQIYKIIRKWEAREEKKICIDKEIEGGSADFRVPQICFPESLA